MARNQAGQDYLEAVGRQIRWPRARRMLLQELGGHLEDQEADFTAAGLAPEVAGARAAAEMGDPISVGRELDRLHRPQWSWPLLLFLAGVLLAGLWAVGLYADKGQLARQYAGLAVGLAVMAITWFSDYTLLYRARWILPFTPLALIGFALFLLVPSPVSNLWSGLFWRYCYYTPLLLSPLFGALICRLQGRGYGVVLLLGVLPLVAGFLAKMAPSIVISVLVMLSMLLVLTAAILSGWFRGKRLPALLLAWGPTLVRIVLTLFIMQGYENRRIYAMLHPESDPFGMGWSILQIRSVLGEIGLSSGVEALPPIFQGEHPLSLDYFMVRLAASYGWQVIALIALAALCLFGYLLWRIRKLKSVSARLMALAPASVLLLQLASNVFLCFGWGGYVLPLPFFAHGPTFLVVDLFLAGLLLSVFRMDALVRDGPGWPVPRRPSPQPITIPLFGRQITIDISKPSGKAL